MVAKRLQRPEPTVPDWEEVEHTYQRDRGEVDESLPASDPPSWTALCGDRLPARKQEKVRGPLIPEGYEIMPLTPAEWRVMCAENREGASNFVGLMVTTFAFGLILYTSLCFWIFSSIPAH